MRKLSKKTSKIIIDLGKAYNVDLLDFNNHEDIYLKLKNGSYMPLCLEKHHPYIFSLNHTFVLNGDLMYDPDFEFFINEVDDQIIIVPLTFTNSSFGIREKICYLNDDCNAIKNYYPRRLRDAVDHINLWFGNLKVQEWYIPGRNPKPAPNVKIIS